MYILVTASRKLLCCSPETRAAHVTNKTKTIISAYHLQVQHFLESDDNSTMITGKRDTFIKNKIKMQKWFLHNTLFNLHQIFFETNSLKISYSQFWCFKPFQIVVPYVNRRDTCLCIKHSNFEMLVSSLLRNHIISEKSLMQLRETLTCSSKTQKCLMQTCSKCKSNVVSYNEFSAGDSMIYHKWVNDGN